MTDRSDVVIVGAGPTGLMLAGELHLAGVTNLVVLERRPTAELEGSRGGGIHSRTIELLDQRGIVAPFLDEGTRIDAVTFGSTRIDLSGLPTRFPFTLALFQGHIERLLLAWVEGLGVTVRRGVEVTGVEQDEDGVTVLIADGAGVSAGVETVRGRFVVGADGGRSVVRRSAGIAFDGAPATRSTLIAEVRTAEELGPIGRTDERGPHGLHPMGDGVMRVVVTEAAVGAATPLTPTTPPTLDDLRRELSQVFGTDFGVHSPTWISRFTNATRQAATYRAGRILLAGDSAHIHSPTGGQGIGLGIQDAVNLGWKLGQVVRGRSDESLLDTYDSERRPAGARALDYTMAQSLFQATDPRQDALRRLLDLTLSHGDAGLPVASLITGLDIVYAVAPVANSGHPLLGRRIPDLELITERGHTTVFALLHGARPLLLILGGLEPELELELPDHVELVSAMTAGPWEAPVIGEVPTPTAVLVRPDGHVAWVGEGSSAGLGDAVARWC